MVHQDNKSLPVSSHPNKPLCFPSNKLYGRDKDIALLRQLCLGTESSTKSQVILISAPSGMGKSALAQTLQEPMGQNGYFVQGKYDFGTHREAYSAITQACRQLCQQIDMKGSALEMAKEQSRTGSTHQSPNKLRLALDTTSIHALATLVPSILQLTGTSKDEHEYAMAVGDVQKNRIQYAFVQFLKAVVTGDDSKSRPLVMVIDDLQWADLESFALLQALVKEMPAAFSLIGCYRDNEVKDDETHFLHKWMRDYRNESVFRTSAEVTEIMVQPMEAETLAQMLSDVMALSIDCEETDEKNCIPVVS